VIVTYDRDDERRRMVITVAGAFDLAATLAMVAHVAADAAWSYAILYDTRELTSVPTMMELQMIVDRVQTAAAHQPRGPVAVVAPDAAVNAMGQVYARRQDGKVKVAVFQTLDEGRRWLDRAEQERKAI
jgi:hypothetical protein